MKNKNKQFNGTYRTKEAVLAFKDVPNVKNVKYFKKLKSKYHKNHEFNIDTKGYMGVTIKVNKLKELTKMAKASKSDKITLLVKNNYPLLCQLHRRDKSNGKVVIAPVISEEEIINQIKNGEF